MDNTVRFPRAFEFRPQFAQIEWIEDTVKQHLHDNAALRFQVER